MESIWQNSYVQIAFRCLAVYFFIIIAIRIFGKKELAQLSVVDLVFILLISNAVQNAMVGPDISLAGGLTAALVLFGVNYLLKRWLYRNPSAGTLLQGRAVLLIYKGIIQHEHLRQNAITEAELEAAVREHGVEDHTGVDLAMLEADGSISVISDDFRRRSQHALPHRRKHRLKGKVK